MKTDVIAQDCFAPVNINCERDGAVITLQNLLPPAEAWDSTISALKHWAAITPDSVFLAERAADGNWATLDYAEAERSTAEIAAHLLALGCSTDRPLLIASPNSIRHAQLTLAAQRVGVPVATVSLAYATVASDLNLSDRRPSILVMRMLAHGRLPTLMDWRQSWWMNRLEDLRPRHSNL
jgi:long-subunit acyl-CoA synthetase (AMP-forming)